MVQFNIQTILTVTSETERTFFFVHALGPEYEM
jgi:hypothetical protein